MIQKFKSETPNKNFLAKEFVIAFLYINIIMFFIQIIAYPKLSVGKEYGSFIDIIFRISIQIIWNIVILIDYIFKRQVIAISLDNNKNIIIIKFMKIFGPVYKNNIDLNKLALSCNPHKTKSIDKLVLIFHDATKSTPRFKIFEDKTGWTKETLEEITLSLMLLKKANPNLSKMRLTFFYNQKKYFEKILQQRENEIENK
jgi:hypothetical protein